MINREKWFGASDVLAGMSIDNDGESPIVVRTFDGGDPVVVAEFDDQDDFIAWLESEDDRG